MYRQRKNKLRVTQSLLSDWMWSFKKDDGYEDVLRTLHREKKPSTFAMLEGIRYENCLNSILNGEPLPMDHEWHDPLLEMAVELQGSQQQVTLFKDTMVGDQPILLHGVLDYLLCGHIYDCKYSPPYGTNKGHLNKYHWSNTPQTSMYLSLVPEALDFTYIISDGMFVYRERYPREIVPPIEPTIRDFLAFLQTNNLMKDFEQYWKVGG